jgi:hypothetical protein
MVDRFRQLRFSVVKWKSFVEPKINTIDSMWLNQELIQCMILIVNPTITISISTQPLLNCSICQTNIVELFIVMQNNNPRFPKHVDGDWSFYQVTNSPL